ncbi:MAG: PilN domain-containing protein, partial [Gammaproteobacteria bacterium]|nr:PilN domain-containing protein [Gammaproteobacteria bacterium]
ILVHMSFESKITDQNNRNTFLSDEISQLDEQIKEIEKLEKQKQELLNRMQIVQSLQQSRPLVVRLFDELVRQIPSGVYLTKFERKKKRLSLTGVSESTPRISAFMRNIEKSQWLVRPDVSDIKANTNSSMPTTTFNMSAREKGLKKRPKAKTNNKRRR